MVLRYLFCAILFASFITPSTKADNKIDKINTLAESRWAADAPGGAIAVLKNGKLVHEIYRGLADIEVGTPISQSTLFKYASVTKRYTAAAILALVESGKISLDDTLSNYLPNLSKAYSEITVRQLLNHTSGIPTLFEYVQGKKYSTAEQIAQITKLPLDFKPGTNTGYSNNGYILLGAIMEKLTSKPWHQAINTREMPSINYITDIVSSGQSTAVAYDRNDNGYKPAIVHHPSLLHAAGGLAGTVKDTALWVSDFHNGKIISNALEQEARKKIVLADGTKAFFSLGFYETSIRGNQAFVQNGGNPGLGMETIFIPEQNISIAVAANTEFDAYDIAMRTAAIILDDPFPTFNETNLNLTKVWPFLGSYQYDFGATERIFLKGEQLYIQYQTEPATPLLYAGDNIYFYGPKSLSWLELEVTDDGNHTLLFYDNGSKTPLIGVKKH